MKSNEQSYKTIKPNPPRPKDVSSNNASSTSSGPEQKQSWWTQLKFKGDEEEK
jgi:hypothetical protein